MSDIFEAIKDAVNPTRREQATVETYDSQKRGPYSDYPPAGDGQPELLPPSEAENPGRAERGDLSASTGQPSGSPTSQHPSTAEQPTPSSATMALGRTPKPASGTGYGVLTGTYGLHASSTASALDPHVGSDRSCRFGHGLSDNGGAAAKPVYKEGGKCGLS